ncbi:unnamed protein product, partial [marine sediment metagenome]
GRARAVRIPFVAKEKIRNQPKNKTMPIQTRSLIVPVFSAIVTPSLKKNDLSLFLKI